MDSREEIYRGSKRHQWKLVDTDIDRKAVHVRNMVSELIESQVSASLPQPKVTAMRPGDEKKAKLIEDMIRNEMDRLPMEALNDLMERTVPIQGGAIWFVEWNHFIRTQHHTFGELSISAIHPKQLVPQNGIFTDISDMDYFILKLPQTKEYIRRRYGVNVEDETEEEPEARSFGDPGISDDLVTQYVAYYRNTDGSVGMFSWVGDQVICDMEHCQLRRLRRCKHCKNVVEPSEVKCPNCGSVSFLDSEEEYEEAEVVGKSGKKEIVRVPQYKPNLFPAVLQKSISVYGKLLGESDVDKIADQQNTANRIETKIIDKLLKSGSYITLPDEASIRFDAEDMKVIRPGNAANKSLIDVYDLQGNVEYDLIYLNQVYEEARQIIGITESFQGRRDTTATSGKAKEFAAAQTAGRLESKRVMKEAAYARLFEMIFKFKLAYADEPRPVISKDDHGNAKYELFNRYDFLEQDESGEWYWNDAFVFSCDTSAPLASNREAMWQETRMNLQSGAFGDPSDPTTLILFWSKMDMLHYPGAGETKRYLEEKMQSESKDESSMSGSVNMPQNQAANRGAGNGEPEIPAPDNLNVFFQSIDQKAKADALATVRAKMQ